MDRAQLAGLATSQHVADAIAENRAAFDVLQPDHHDKGDATSIREATYKGHHIKVTTTYRLEVDGVTLEGHVLVNTAGRVHYHAIPNQEFRSAIDMVKRVIDLADLPVAAEPEPGPSGGHHEHDPA